MAWKSNPAYFFGDFDGLYNRLVCGYKEDWESVIRFADLGHSLAQALAAIGFGVRNHFHRVKYDFSVAVYYGSKCLEWLEEQSAYQDQSALYCYGLFFHVGIAVPIDLPLAFRFMQMAAAQGCGGAAAEHMCGQFSLDGEGTEQNRVEAAKLFLQAANKKFVLSQVRLGECYERGVGVPTQLQEATRYNAMAAKHKYPPAMCKLGDCYMNGLGVSKDINAALSWYTAAAEADYPVGLFKLAQYRGGPSMHDDSRAEALALYRQSAQQGCAEAQFTLGIKYYEGASVHRDYLESIAWFHLCAESALPAAYYYVGLSFLEGHGVPKDLNNSLKYLQLAASTGYEAAQGRVETVLAAVNTQANNDPSYLFADAMLELTPLLFERPG
jgi:TPR repeat protein